MAEPRCKITAKCPHRYCINSAFLQLTKQVARISNVSDSRALGSAQCEQDGPLNVTNPIFQVKGSLSKNLRVCQESKDTFLTLWSARRGYVAGPVIDYMPACKALRFALLPRANRLHGATTKLVVRKSIKDKFSEGINNRSDSFGIVEHENRLVTDATASPCS